MSRPGPSPKRSTLATLAAFVRHARLFGTECVAGTAADYLEPAELNRLMIELDAIDRGQKSSRGFRIGKRRRRRSDETAAMVAQLRSEGLVPSAIADKLGAAGNDAYPAWPPDGSEDRLHQRPHRGRAGVGDERKWLGPDAAHIRSEQA